MMEEMGKEDMMDKMVEMELMEMVVLLLLLWEKQINNIKDLIICNYKIFKCHNQMIIL